MQITGCLITSLFLMLTTNLDHGLDQLTCTSLNLIAFFYRGVAVDLQTQAFPLFGVTTGTPK
jgi:hypothetical protein